MGVELLGLQLAPVWDAGVPGSFTHYTIVLVPECFILIEVSALANFCEAPLSSQHILRFLFQTVRSVPWAGVWPSGYLDRIAQSHIPALAPESSFWLMQTPSGRRNTKLGPCHLAWAGSVVTLGERSVFWPLCLCHSASNGPGTCLILSVFLWLQRAKSFWPGCGHSPSQESPTRAARGEVDLGHWDSPGLNPLTSPGPTGWLSCSGTRPQTPLPSG